MKSFAKFSKRVFQAFLFMVTLFLFACDGGGGGGGGGDSSSMVFRINNSSDLELIEISEHTDKIEEIWSGSVAAGEVEDLDLDLGEQIQEGVGFTLVNTSSYEIEVQMNVDKKKYGREFDVDFEGENGSYTVTVKYNGDIVSIAYDADEPGSISFGPGKPGCPTYIQVQSASSTSLTIEWNIAGAESYVIYRSTEEDGTYTQIKEVDGEQTSYTDTGLVSSTTYYYKIKGKKNGFLSDYSNVRSGTPSSSFSPGTGSFSIPAGTYSLSGTSYVFKAGNLLDMTTGGSTVSDISYTFSTSDGDLTFGYGLDSDGTNDMSWTYHNCFTVTSGGTTYLFMPGFKKTSGSATSIIGTYVYSMSTDAMGTVTDVVSTMTYSSGGTWTVTTTTTGQPDQTVSGTWDTSANTVTGYSFVTINGGLYMYVPTVGFQKE